jgi:predicted SprT family Zn-dependent metalloprotease
MSTSAESARRQTPKIDFTCTCGKKYRVAASKAGKSFRCKRCRLKLTVPGDAGAVSLRTRKAILEELGIDAEAAEKAFTEEQEKVYTCALCSAKIPTDAVAGSYAGELGIVCAPCRAVVAESKANEDGEGGEKKKKQKQQLQAWSTQGTPEQARRSAIAYAALFFAGIAGFVHSIFGPAIWVTLLVAGAVAAIGGRSIYTASLGRPEPVKKK